MYKYGKFSYATYKFQGVTSLSSIRTRMQENSKMKYLYPISKQITIGSQIQQKGHLPCAIQRMIPSLLF